MKKYLLTTALALGLGAFGLATSATATEHLVEAQTPFFIANPDTRDASVEVTAHFDKEKDKFVFEFIFKLKVAVVLVTQFADGATAAESLVVVEQENFLNVVDHSTLPPLGITDVDLSVALADSIDRNTGVTQANFDVGNMVNQGNVLSASVAGTAVFADAVAAAEQFTVLNVSVTTENPEFFVRENAQKRISITDSINDNEGVTQTNVNVGNMNNQLNAVSIAIGGDAELALSESDLGQTTAYNIVLEESTIRTTTITNSMNGNTGITSTNTATGNMNNQATVISISGSASF